MGAFMKIASWSEILSALPDPAFFEVVRHYLGPVSTPFHKPEIIGRMEEFFNRPEVIQRAVDYIEPPDALVLTYIRFYRDPTDEVLNRIVADIRYAALRDRLLNLEERLLIWVRKAPAGRHYELTPLGEAAVNAGLLGPGCITGLGVEFDGPRKSGWLDDNFLNAALAFLSEGIPLFLKEGGWRKKTLELLTRRFPSLFHDDRGEERLILAGRGLIAAGLAVRHGEILEPVLSAWKEIESYTPSQRRILLRARAAAGKSLSLDDAVRATHLVTDCLPAGRAYPPGQLANLFQLAAGGSSPLSPLGARRIISHLELMEELTSDESGNLAGSTAPVEQNESSPAPLTSITPAGDIVLRPGMPLFCDLALSTEPVKVDVVTVFRMDKNRFLAGLDAGVDPGRLFSELERHSGHPVPPNMTILAREWEAEYRTVRLSVGVVLQAEGFRRQLIEDAGILADCRHTRLADGLWLLDPAEESRWRGALASIGIDRLPPLSSFGTVVSDPCKPAAQYPQTPLISWNGEFSKPEMCSYSWIPPSGKDLTGIMEELKLKAETVPLSPEEREAFKERLERRLIMVPEQIRKGSWRYEVMSVKGLDYRGKLRLVEAAMAGREERLELTLAAGNSVETILVLPEKIEKDGDEQILVATVLPEETEMRFRIRKIGFMRRIKASLF
jgi:hypothetical protein